MLRTTTKEEHEAEYGLLMYVITTGRQRPDNLLFWATNMPKGNAQRLWSECPRADWLMWLAREFRFPEGRLQTIEALVSDIINVRRERELSTVKKRKHEEPFTPTSIKAELTRRHISWYEVAIEPRTATAAQ